MANVLLNLVIPLYFESPYPSEFGPVYSKQWLLITRHLVGRLLVTMTPDTHRLLGACSSENL